MKVIKVNNKPGVRPTVVEFMVDGFSIRVKAGDGRLRIESDIDMAVVPINGKCVEIKHNVGPAFAAAG